MFKSLLFTLGILPMTALAFQVGAWVGGPGQYPQPTQENVQAFQDLQGTHIDLISYFALFDMNDWDATEEYANVAKDNGSTLVVTWMANGYNAQDLVNGKADEYIRDYAKGVKGYGEEIWLRPLHEANGDWYDWSVGKAGAGNTATFPSTVTTGANAKAGLAGRRSRRCSKNPTTHSPKSTSRSLSPKFPAPNSAVTRPNGLRTCSSTLLQTSPAYLR